MQINTNELQHALNIVKPFIGKSYGKNILFTVTGGKATFAANNLERQAETFIECQADIVRVLLPAKIVEIVQSLTAPETELTIDNQNITVRAGATFKLFGNDDDFPVFEPGDVVSEFTLNTEKLNLTFACSNEISRPSFSGVYFNNGTLTASDTYRLAWVKADFEGTALVPGNFLRLISKPGEVKCKLSEKYLQIESGNTIYTTRLLEEKYPDVSNVIPAECKTSLTVDTSLFNDTLNRARLLTEGKNQAVNLVVDGDVVVKVSSEVGSMEETLTAQVDGEPVDMWINAAYLQDGLKFAGEAVTYHFNGDEGPVVQQGEMMYLILPVKKVQ